MLGPADFAGSWRISRQIDDHFAGQSGRFDGEAVLTPQGPGQLAYAETGVLRLGNGPALEARRSYLWQFDAAGVAVFFDDGRPFHRFCPGGLAEGTEHPCAADLYRVTYDFRHWPEWSAGWRVVGPRKDYQMMGLYRRL